MVYPTVSMIAGKLADIRSNSYYIFFNLQCQRQHLFQPQVSVAIKFFLPQKGIKHLADEVPGDLHHNVHSRVGAI